MTETSSGSSKPCQFPFVFLNHTFNGCTNIEKLLPNGEYKLLDKPWCSTRREFGTNHHIEGKGFWGDCPRNCKVETVTNRNQQGNDRNQ